MHVDFLAIIVVSNRNVFDIPTYFGNFVDFEKDKTYKKIVIVGK